MSEEKSETYCSDFEILLKQYIEKLDEIIKKLNDLLEPIGRHHLTCNKAKTAGTAISSTGVAMVVGSILLSPFTGGVSLTVGAGGAVMSITGSLSNVITDYIDYKTSNLIMDDIQKIVESKKHFDENLHKQLNNFGMVIEKLVENGVDKESAIIIAVKGIATGCIDLTEEPNMKLMNTLSAIVKLQHVESAALQTLPVIGKAMHISEKSLQFIYNFFGLTKHSGTIIFTTIGRISSVVSAAFTIVDIALLIRDWTMEHPTVEVVLDTMKKLEEEKKILSDFVEVIDSSRGEVEHIFHKVLEEIEKLDDDDLLGNDFVFVPREVESF